MCRYSTFFNENQTPRSDSVNLEPSEPIFCPQILAAVSGNTKGYSSTYLAMGFANVRAGTPNSGTQAKIERFDKGWGAAFEDLDAVVRSGLGPL